MPDQPRRSHLGKTPCIIIKGKTPYIKIKHDFIKLTVNSGKQNHSIKKVHLLKFNLNRIVFNINCFAKTEGGIKRETKETKK